jgi:1-acyl-sn-glycerol-3-phosphate acyltransferase
MPAWLAYSWYETVYWLSAIALTVGFSLRIEGRRHIPRRGPVLLIANHQSFLDPALVGLAAPRQLCFLARETLFRHWPLAFLIRSLNAVPIHHEGLGKEGLRTILQQLRDGRAVIVFPEGTRTPDGAIHSLRAGIQLLIKRVQAPIVPVGIAGAFEAWPRWSPLPIPAPLFLKSRVGTLAVSVGQPLDAKRLAEMPREEALGELQRELEAAQVRAERLRKRHIPVV